MNALKRIHRSLVPGGWLLDLQPTFSNSTARTRSGLIVPLRIRFPDARRVNSALRTTTISGLFAKDREIMFPVIYRCKTYNELVAEIESWTDTSIPAAFQERLKSSARPFEVHESAMLRRFHAL